MTSLASLTDGADKWTIFVDGSVAYNATGAGAWIILENENGILIEVSLALSFPTSNNQAEY
ncbi:gag-pol polyprotein, partial [Trifolium medium]|nr:gag-pol polyprotein [Trifolium medium]